jgi:hypothetical protein
MRRVVIDCDDLGFTAAIDSLGTRRAVRRHAWKDVSATHYEEVPEIYGRVGYFTVTVNSHPVIKVDTRRTPGFAELVATVNRRSTGLPYTWEPQSSGAGDVEGPESYLRRPRASAPV